MKTGTLRLYGPVGAGLEDAELEKGGSITARGVADQLDALAAQGVKALDVYLSSDGGYVSEGLAVYAQLARFPGEITTHIDGRALSIASAIFMAGKKRKMPKAGLMMMHAPWVMALGNAAQLRKAADDLDVMASALTGIYAQAAGMDPAAVGALMDEESWLTADKALEMGFATEIPEDRGAPASASASLLVNSYRNTPDALRTMRRDLALSKLEANRMRHKIEQQARGASVLRAVPAPQILAQGKKP